MHTAGAGAVRTAQQQAAHVPIVLGSMLFLLPAALVGSRRGRIRFRLNWRCANLLSKVWTVCSVPNVPLLTASQSYN